MSDVLLPGCLADIARIAGVPAALAVADRWGGVRLHVPLPTSLHAEHPLVLALGVDAAMRIAEYFAGERLEVPKADEWKLAARNAAIRQAYALGDSQSTLARRYALTERHIRNILGQDAPDLNMDMFA